MNRGFKFGHMLNILYSSRHCTIHWLQDPLMGVQNSVSIDRHQLTKFQPYLGGCRMLKVSAEPACDKFEGEVEDARLVVRVRSLAAMPVTESTSQNH